MRQMFLAFALAAVAPCGYAADAFCDTGHAHPIDVQFDRDMEQSGGVTVEMRTAQGRAYESWDKELNRVYGALMEVLSGEEKILLRDAQRAWIGFRDTEAKFWWAEGLTGAGTMQPLLVSGYGIDLVRARVCDLTRYRTAVVPR